MSDGELQTETGRRRRRGGSEQNEKRCLTDVILLHSPCFVGTTALWLQLKMLLYQGSDIHNLHENFSKDWFYKSFSDAQQ